LRHEDEETTPQLDAIVYTNIYSTFYIDVYSHSIFMRMQTD